MLFPVVSAPGLMGDQDSLSSRGQQKFSLLAGWGLSVKLGGGRLDLELGRRWMDGGFSKLLGIF